MQSIFTYSTPHKFAIACKKFKEVLNIADDYKYYIMYQDAKQHRENNYPNLPHLQTRILFSSAFIRNDTFYVECTSFILTLYSLTYFVVSNIVYAGVCSMHLKCRLLKIIEIFESLICIPSSKNLVLLKINKLLKIKSSFSKRG